MKRGAFRDRLAQPVDGASLAVFRIAFGLVMTWEACWFLWPWADRIRTCFSPENWHFPFPGFSWVQPWPLPLLYLHVAVAAIAAIFVAAGLFYRTASAVLFVSFSYLFLLDAAWYLNHFYLMCLLSLVLIALPAQRCYSIDAWRRARADGVAAGRFIPFWPIFLLRAQTAVLYVYAGIAKLDSDWLSGAPLAAWEPARHLGRLLGTEDRGAVLLAWGGLLFDLFIVFLLLARRARWLGLALAFLFHATNLLFFPIGVFPVLAFALTLLFCEPDWPRRLAARLRRSSIRLVEREGRAVLSAAPRPLPRAVPGLICVWLAFHAIVPLRHLGIAGDASWTEEGYWFSWRMMLKQATPRFLRFEVRDPRLARATGPADAPIDWSAWPSDAPHRVHVPTDATRVDWTTLGRRVVTWEPTIGMRLLDNPLARDDRGGTVEERAERIRGEWTRASRREPQIFPTQPLGEALSSVEREVRALSVRPAQGEPHGAAISLLARARRIASSEAESARTRMELLDVLHEIGTSRSPCGSVLVRGLRRLEPFSLQGARETGLPFLVIEDSTIAEAEAVEVLVDLARLRPAAWHALPSALLLREAGRYRVVWNHHTELNSAQVLRMGRSPWMIHRYARRIADRWERATGVRPEVRATSYVSLNQRTPRPLVDPAIDLASAPIHYFRHNPWILDEDPAPADASRPEPAAGDSP